MGVWLCVGFVMCGCVLSVGFEMCGYVVMCGFCNVWVCVIVIVYFSSISLHV